MDNKIIISLLIIILIIAGAYIGYKELQDYKSKILNQGFIIGQENIVLQINQQGKIPVLNTIPDTNQTQLNWIPIKEICEVK